MDWIRDHKPLMMAGIFAIMIMLYFTLGMEDSKQQEVNGDMFKTEEGKLPEEQKEVAPEAVQPPEINMADIKGAIIHPGVYIVAEGSRVIDLIQQAGGLADDADPATVNFSQHVTDEMVIYIPKKGEEISTAAATQPNAMTAGKKTINLNAAGEAELLTLPGIGPAKAAAIIEYREVNGPFKSIEDIKEISGIGDKTFEKLKEEISVK